MFHNSLYKGQKLLLALFALFFCKIVFGQVNITGAQCVLTTLVYQYDIKGDWKENDKISICVDGGVLTETGTTCIEKQTVSFVKVQWSEGKTTGKITVNSGAGASNISVNIAPHFNPGSIETTDKQTIAYNKLSPSLYSTQASGGNCSPSFSYQWEQSLNKLQWIAISGATGRNLSFDTPLKQTTFFRRKVFESKSQTIGYTNAITVFVSPEAKKK
jgi:hypothetical protein